MARREPRIQSIKRENISFGRNEIFSHLGENISHFPFFFSVEREREKEMKVYFGDSWDFVTGNSLGQELKFITLTRATRRYRK